MNAIINSFRSLPRWARRTIPVVIVMVIIGAAAGGSKKSTTASSSSPTAKTTGSTTASCGTKATESCTPHVGPNGTVRVDTLDWSNPNVYQDASLPLTELTAPDGDRYVVVFLKVHSGKSEQVLMTNEVVDLTVGKRTYKQDSTALAEWNFPPSPPLDNVQIQAGETLHLTAIFKLPVPELSSHPELRFNELGFGETHAYIALPQPIRSHEG